MASGSHQMSPGGVIRPVRAEDWEPYRSSIARIYADNTLEFTIEQMKAAHGFVATVKQYKKKIKDWGLDNKYIKDYEYEALLLLPEAKEYTVRGRVVPSKDVLRYKRRRAKNSNGQGGSSVVGSDDAGEGASGAVNDAVDAGSYTAEGLATYDYGLGDNYGYVPTSGYGVHDTNAAASYYQESML